MRAKKITTVGPAPHPAGDHALIGAPLRTLSQGFTLHPIGAKGPKPLMLQNKKGGSPRMGFQERQLLNSVYGSAYGPRRQTCISKGEACKPRSGHAAVATVQDRRLSDRPSRSLGRRQPNLRQRARRDPKINHER